MPLTFRCFSCNVVVISAPLLIIWLFLIIQLSTQSYLTGPDNTTIAGIGVVGAESICTGLMISLSPSALMTQEIDPTIKTWPGFGEEEEPKKCTILFVMETSRTPLPGAPTVDKRCSAVLRGVSHEGRLIDGGARNQEQEGNRDTRVRQVRVVCTT